MYSPVTRIHHLITYESACRLVRRDRTWEFNSMDRMRGHSSSDDESEDNLEIGKLAVVRTHNKSEDKNKDSEEGEFAIGIMKIQSPAVTGDLDNEGGKKTNHKRRRRRRRRRRSQKSDFLQQDFSACLEKISLLIDELCPSLYKPNTSNRIVDEFCFWASENFSVQFGVYFVIFC